VSFEAEPRAKEMKKLYEQVRAQIEKVNEQYKQKANQNYELLEFKLGDLVWSHLRWERFPSRRKNKLMASRDGPYMVVQMHIRLSFREICRYLPPLMFGISLLTLKTIKNMMKI